MKKRSSLNFYTFVMEYAQGSYLAQVRGVDVEAAKTEWFKWLTGVEIVGMQGASKAKLVASIREDEPVEVEGLTNTWCLFSTVRGKPCLITVIQTMDRESH